MLVLKKWPGDLKHAMLVLKKLHGVAVVFSDRKFFPVSQPYYMTFDIMYKPLIEHIRFVNANK